MKEYLNKNKLAYDNTAKEFEEKIQIRRKGTKRIVDYFILESKKQSKNNKSKVLELGTGSGYASFLLTEAGYDVSAIEFSENMAEIARRTAPKAWIIVDEFLSHDFKSDKFDLIFAVAFVHLFDDIDTDKVFQKIKSLLNDDGLVLIATTKHDKMSSGFRQKTNFKNSAVRYRRQFSQDGMKNILENNGFKILSIDIVNDDEVSGKTWMSFVAKVSNG